MQYKYVGSAPISIPALGLYLKPGDKCEVAEKINHSDFEEIKAQKASKKTEGEE